MKQYIHIIFLVIGTFLINSCIGDIEYTPKDSSDKLIVNGIIDASKTEHELYIELNQNNKNIPVKNARIKVLVNDKEAKNIKFKATNPKRPEFYTLNAKFNAEDKVRIEINAGKYNAYAEGILPKAPNLENLKSLGPAKCSFYDSDYDTEKYSLDLNDFTGEDNFYQAYAIKYLNIYPLNSKLENEYNQKKKESMENDGGSLDFKTFAEIIEEFGKSIDNQNIENCISETTTMEFKRVLNNQCSGGSSTFHIISDDPAITDQVSNKFNEEMGFALNTNFHMVFSDNLFHDSKYNLKLNIPRSRFHRYDDGLLYEELSQIPLDKRKVCIGTTNSGIGIVNMSKETFFYCKAINVLIAKESDDEFNIFGNQPAVIVNNIEGGLGFIKFVTSTEIGFNKDLKKINDIYFIDYFAYEINADKERPTIYLVKEKTFLF